MARSAIVPGYAETPAGHIHYRQLGDGPPLVLMHWAPASGRMYEAVMPHLAERGFRAIALDLPGYGRSHHGLTAPAIPEIAANLWQALDALGIDRCHLLGGHLSSSIGVAMARAAPERIGGLVLDGLINLTPEERGHLMATFAGLSPRIADGDGFKAFPMEMAIRSLREWNPDFRLDERSLHQVYDLLADYLQMGLGQIGAFVDPAAPQPPPYPLADELTRLAVPTLLLTAEREALRPGYDRSLAAIPGGRGHEFGGVHPLFSNREADYAAVIADFLAPLSASA